LDSLLISPTRELGGFAFAYEAGTRAGALFNRRKFVSENAIIRLGARFQCIEGAALAYVIVPHNKKAKRSKY